MQVAKEDEIWKIAAKVWEELPSLKIVKEFYLARRIAEKILKCKGGDIFLEGAKGGLASGLRKEFKGTDDGNKTKYEWFVAFDGDSNDNDNVILPRYGKEIVAI